MSQWIHPYICTLLLLYRRILQFRTCTSADSPFQKCLLDTTPHSSVLWTLEDTDMSPSRDHRELHSHTCTADCSLGPNVCHHSLEGKRTNWCDTFHCSVFWIQNPTYPEESFFSPAWPTPALEKQHTFTREVLTFIAHIFQWFKLVTLQ